jgi:hypothetical protein
MDSTPQNIVKGPVPQGWLLLDSIYNVINAAFLASNVDKKVENMSAWYIIKSEMMDIADGGQKKCYMCSGYGHAAEICPTGKVIRQIGQNGQKLKAFIVGGIAEAKISAI